LIQAAKLSGGARVILEPVDHTEALSVGFWQVYGSRDELETQAGFSHFLEHMVFKGTARRGAYQIAQAIDRVGGYLNAFTEKEVTCFYCTLPAEHADVAVDVLADMMQGAELDQEEIRKEKSVVVNEIKTVEDNPEEKGQQYYLERLWRGHPLSRPITGLAQQVTSIQQEKLREFYHRRFTPANTVVTASGKLMPAEFLELLERWLPPGDQSDPGPPRRPPQEQPLWQVLPDKFEQVQVYTGTTYSPSPLLEEYYRDLVFNTLFGESMSSRLFQRLREEQGLCYSVYSFRTYFTDIALWTIHAITLPDSAAALLRALEAEIARLRREPPQEQEIEDAKSQLKGNMILSMEDMENRMKRLFRQHHLTGRTVEYAESLRLLSQVSRDDVMAIVEQRVRPERFSLLAYGSRKFRRLPMQRFDL
jgi:predicted Zn-dependent peptidase